MSEAEEGAIRAGKFLDERGRGTITGFTWPAPTAAVPAGGLEPGGWVEAGGPLEPCVRGIHACRPGDLAWWLSAQLWEMELAGAQLADRYTVVAERGRLVRRVDDWPEVGDELARWAVWRNRDQAVTVLQAAADTAGDTAGDGHGQAQAVSAARALAACDDLDQLAEVASNLPRPDDQAQAMAIDLLVDNLTDPPNPVPACHTSARAAGHAGSTDGDVAAYELAFAQERQRQGLWLANRLGLVVD